jgi:formate hydrogenlyase subunit 3/multisubunit Na+/H+ antiporter MnhD subunit
MINSGSKVHTTAMTSNLCKFYITWETMNCSAYQYIKGSQVAVRSEPSTSTFLFLSLTHFCYRTNKLQGIEQMEGLGKLIKIIHPIGS